MAEKTGYGETGGALAPDEADLLREPGELDRPDLPFSNDHGLRVIMTRGGFTKKGLLRTPFRFQVPPLESITRQASHTFGDYETLERGTFDRPGGRSLRTLSFNSMFIDYDASFVVVEGAPDPIQLSDELEEICQAGTPFWLTIGQDVVWGRANKDVHMRATLRSVSIEQRAGEIDTRYFSADFTEHRRPHLRRRKRRGSAPDGKAGHRYRITDERYTLYQLATYFYGDPTMWSFIAKANKIPVTPTFDLRTIDPYKRAYNKKKGILLIPAAPDIPYGDDPSETPYEANDGSRDL